MVEHRCVRCGKPAYDFMVYPVQAWLCVEDAEAIESIPASAVPDAYGGFVLDLVTRVEEFQEQVAQLEACLRDALPLIDWAAQKMGRYLSDSGIAAAARAHALLERDLRPQTADSDGVEG